MINGAAEIVCRILYANIFTKIPFFGYWGIWITTGATWITTALVCLYRYRSVTVRGILASEKSESD